MYSRGYNNEGELPATMGNYDFSGLAPFNSSSGAYPVDRFPQQGYPTSQHSRLNAQDLETMDPVLIAIDLANYEKRKQASVMAPIGSSVDAASPCTQNPSTPARGSVSQPQSYQSPYSASRYSASTLISPSPIASSRAEQNNTSPTPGSRATQRIKDAGFVGLAVASLAVANGLSDKAKPSSSGPQAAVEPFPFLLPGKNTRLGESSGTMKEVNNIPTSEASKLADVFKATEPSGILPTGSLASTLAPKEGPLAEKCTKPQDDVAFTTVPTPDTIPRNEVASTSSIKADPEGVTSGLRNVPFRPSQKARRRAHNPSVGSSVATSTTVSSTVSPSGSSNTLDSGPGPSDLAEPWDAWARRPRLPSALESGDHRKYHPAIQVPRAFKESTPAQPVPFHRSIEKTNSDSFAPHPSELGTNYNATFVPAKQPRPLVRTRDRATTPPSNSAFCCEDIRVRCPPSKTFLYEHSALATKFYTLFNGPTPTAQLTNVPYGPQVNAADWCIEVRDIVKTVPQDFALPPEHPANDQTKLLKPMLYMHGSDNKYYGSNEWVLVTNPQDQASLKMRLKLVDCDGYERLRVGCPRHVNEYAIGIWVTPQVNAEEKNTGNAETKAKAPEEEGEKKKKRKSPAKSSQEPSPKRKRGLERRLERELDAFMRQESETPDLSSDVAISPYGPVSGSRGLQSSPYPDPEPLEPGRSGGGFAVRMPDSGRQQTGERSGNPYSGQSEDPFWQPPSQFGNQHQSRPGFTGENFFGGHQQMYSPSDRYAVGGGESSAGGAQQTYGQPRSYGGGGSRNATSTSFSPYSERQRTSSVLSPPISYQPQSMPHPESYNRPSTEQSEHAVGGTQSVRRPDGPLQPPAGFDESIFRHRHQ